jgi:hypothetical protein
MHYAPHYLREPTGSTQMHEGVAALFAAVGGNEIDGRGITPMDR